MREINRILRKHGVPRSDRRARIEYAKSTYLRQCLYRSAVDRWWKGRTGFEAHEGWRDQYR